MNDTFKHKIKNRLLAMQEDYRKNFEFEQEEFNKLLKDLSDKDTIDVADEHNAYREFGTLTMQDKERLREIISALYKIEQGTYGECETCGAFIDEGRLEAKPEAHFCIQCRKRREQEGEAR
ncbi:MAG: TraR/DksA family transcriptional regulator [Spirochaetia bacterium]